MPSQAKRCRLNNARRRKSLGDVTANQRWLHLGAGAISVQSTLHSIWRQTSLLCSYSAFFLSVATIVEDGQLTRYLAPATAHYQAQLEEGEY